MDEVVEVFERWKETMGHTRARLDLKRRKAITGMLRVGYTVEDLQLAIFGCSVSDFHQGGNDRGQRYDDITLICRDAEHIDKFVAIAEQKMKKGQKYEGPKEPVSAVPAHVMALVRK